MLFLPLQLPTQCNFKSLLKVTCIVDKLKKGKDFTGFTTVPSFFHPFFTVSLTSFLKKKLFDWYANEYKSSREETENPEDLPGTETKINSVSIHLLFDCIMVELFGSIKIFSITST